MKGKNNSFSGSWTLAVPGQFWKETAIVFKNSIFTNTYFGLRHCPLHMSTHIRLIRIMDNLTFG